MAGPMKEQDKRAEVEFFDKFYRSGGYDRFDERGYGLLLDLVRETVSPKAGDTLVDVGCGSGAFTGRLAQAFPQAKVLGLDLSPGCVAQANLDFPTATFRVGDAENSGLASGSVDILFYSALLHHLPDLERLAREAARVLKPGGRFFSFDPHHYNPAFWLYRCKSSPFYSPVGVTPDERLMTAHEVREVFTAAGLETHTRIVSGVTFSWIESARAKKVLGLYNLFDRALAATPLSRWIGAWVIGYGSKPAAH